MSHLPFEFVSMDTSGNFDKETGKFLVPQTGVYWLTWSAGMYPKDNRVDVRLQGASRSPSVLQKHSLNNENVACRDEIIQLEAGSEIWLSSETNLYSFDTAKLTSFGGLLLDNTMESVVAFSVALFPPVGDLTTHKINFNRILIDTHQRWNYGNAAYEVPIAGTYVITFVAATPANTYFQSRFCVNGCTTLEMMQYSGAHEGPGTTSRTVIAGLSTGNPIYAEVYTGNVLSSNDYQVALMGFLYAPVRFSSVGWCLTTNSALGVPGPIDKFSFCCVIYDPLYLWNAQLSEVQVTIELLEIVTTALLKPIDPIGNRTLRFSYAFYTTTS